MIKSNGTNKVIIVLGMLVLIITIINCININNNIAGTNSINKEYINQFENTYLLENNKIKNIEITNSNGDELRILDLIKDNKIVMVYSETICNSCVEREINNLISIMNEIGKDKILIISSYRGLNSMKILEDKYSKKVSLYSVGQEELDSIISKSYYPVIFVADENLVTKSVYIPSPDKPELSKKYYKIIKSKYFSPLKVHS